MQMKTHLLFISFCSLNKFHQQNQLKDSHICNFLPFPLQAHKSFIQKRCEKSEKNTLSYILLYCYYIAL